MSDLAFFFSGWAPVGRILVVGASMYLALVVLLRISGSRSLATMNAFDLIVTVAIGSSFGRALTAKSVALLEAVAAFVLLLLLQFVVAWSQARWPRLEAVVTNPPTLLFFRGRFLDGPMRRCRISRDSVRATVRKQQVGSLDQVDAVVLESSGELSVIVDLGDASSLADIAGQLDDLDGDHGPR